MKCSSCGQEFGKGEYCTHCGVDRVTGLGHYCGYQTPTSSVPLTDTHISSATDSAHNEEGNQQSLCWHCGEIIPKGAKYCPFCATLLIVRCPNCGLEYSSRYPVCSNCGTNREEYEERRRKEIEEKEEASRAEEAKKQLQIEQNRTNVLNYIYKNRESLKRNDKKSRVTGNTVAIFLIFSISGLLGGTVVMGTDEAIGFGLYMLSTIVFISAILLGIENYSRDTPETDFISQMEKDIGKILIPREEVINAIHSTIEKK